MLISMHVVVETADPEAKGTFAPWDGTSHFGANPSGKVMAFLGGDCNRWGIPEKYRVPGLLTVPPGSSVVTHTFIKELAQKNRPQYICWVPLAHLLSFSYGSMFEDLSDPLGDPESKVPGLSPGEGVMVTLRNFLGPQYFESLDRLVLMQAERITLLFYREKIATDQ